MFKAICHESICFDLNEKGAHKSLAQENSLSEIENRCPEVNTLRTFQTDEIHATTEDFRAAADIDLEMDQASLV